MYSILAAACAALVFVNYAQLYSKLRLNFKPFNCEVCLPFWLCIAIEIWQQQTITWQMPFNGCIAIVLTLLIKSYVRPSGY